MDGPSIDLIFYKHEEIRDIQKVEEFINKLNENKSKFKYPFSVIKHTNDITFVDKITKNVPKLGVIFVSFESFIDNCTPNQTFWEYMRGMDPPESYKLNNKLIGDFFFKLYSKLCGKYVACPFFIILDFDESKFSVEKETFSKKEEFSRIMRSYGSPDAFPAYYDKCNSDFFESKKFTDFVFFSNYQIDNWYNFSKDSVPTKFGKMDEEIKY